MSDVKFTREVNYDPTDIATGLRPVSNHRVKGRSLMPDQPPYPHQCCSLTDGVHDAQCLTERDHEQYRCIRCGQPEYGREMRFGRCLNCQGAGEWVVA